MAAINFSADGTVVTTPWLFDANALVYGAGGSGTGVVARTGLSKIGETVSVMDYGAVGDGVTDDTAAIQLAITNMVAGQVLLFPAKHTFNFTLLSITSKTNFAFQIDGILVNKGAKPGGSSVDKRATDGGLQTINFTLCSKFALYGAGYIQNGYREPLYFLTCTDFSVNINCYGNGTNDNLTGVYVRFCQRFTFKDMEVDGVTLKPTNNSTEVYNSWSNNFQIWDSSDFIINRVITRNSGMNGIYPASNCTDFVITNCICEFNAGSGIQVAWSSFGVFPTRFNISNNVLRYNQADGLDINNTQGSNADIFATIHGNIHAYNGWINCNPSNAAGADGSGIATFINVNRWSATNNQVFECASYGAYVSNCNNWSITDGVIYKTNTGTLNGGVFISGGTSGRVNGLDVKVPQALPAITTQSMNDTVIQDNAFDGLCSFANGTYPGCKFSQNKCTAYNQTLVQFDWLDNDIVVTNAAQNGLFVVNAKCKIQRNVVTATAIGIVNTSVNYTDITGNQVVSTGASSQGIYVNGSTGVNVYGNDGTSVGSVGIHLDNGCASCVLANNRGTSTSGNSLRVESTCTLTQKFGNLAVSGTSSYAGTYGVNF